MRIAAALVAVAALLVAGSGVAGSGAAFTAAKANPSNGFSTAADGVPPAVTLTTPAAGAFVNTATPTLSGGAGDASGDGATVTAHVHAGSAATGTRLQSATATRSGTTWATTAAVLVDGTYTAQASQADSEGNTGISNARTFTVDTTRPLPVEVSAANGGAIAGRPDTGDTITYRFNEPILPGSVLAGFTGASTPVRVRFFDSATIAGDRFTVLSDSGTTAVNLDAGTVSTGGVTLGGANVVTQTVTFASTMVRSADGTSFVITLGNGDQAASRFRTEIIARNMTWHVKVGPQDRATNAILTTPATRVESDADLDF